MSVRKPAGFYTVTPYLIVEGADRLIDFLETVFDAETVAKMQDPSGRINHAEVRIGDSIVMLSEATAEWKPTRTLLYVYVADTDATYRRALDFGATSVREPEDQFYGDRSASVQDPTGNFWGIATHLEEVSPEELEQRTQVGQPAAG